MYLGKQFRLKIVDSDTNSIKLKNGYFFINNSNTNKVNFLLDEWYYEHATRIFNQRLEILYNKHFSNSIAKPSLKIRKMRKRWGSYTKNNEIMLNIELIKASLVCIDYIILHELCHSQYFAHNADFYKLITKLMPDWQKQKARLEKLEL